MFLGKKKTKIKSACILHMNFTFRIYSTAIFGDTSCRTRICWRIHFAETQICQEYVLATEQMRCIYKMANNSEEVAIIVISLAAASINKTCSDQICSYFKIASHIFALLAIVKIFANIQRLEFLNCDC